MKRPGLRSAIGLSYRKAGVLLHPPGASPYLALMLAVAGFEVGFNAPYTIAETLALRTLLTGGIGPFFAALKALPEPTRPAMVSALVLAGLCLFTFGGWINTAHALVGKAEPEPQDWSRGLARSWRALFWAGLAGGVSLVLLGGLGVASAGLIRAWSMGALGGGWQASALPWGVTSAFIVALLVGVYAQVFTFLAAIVAVAEPGTRLMRLPGRTWALFRWASIERFLPRTGVLLLGWFVLKSTLLQLSIPFQPLSGRWGELLSIGGALLNGLLMAGDGAIVLVTVVFAAQLYRAALEAERA